MKFGIFDHMDDAGVPLRRTFRQSAALAEAYDRAGFHAYHLAEHHGTPIGTAASPSVFLAALTQRTSKLRFGPMVYLLPFYHPLRLIEEVCMLDQMSGGRLELGVGRGVSPFETANYALDFAQTQAMYHEAFQVLLKGLAADELTFEGKFYRFDKVPMILHPVQRPHPPLWYGVSIPDNADWPAQNDVNVISLAPPQAVRPIFERYLAVRKRSARTTRRSTASAGTWSWPTPTKPRSPSRGASIRAGARISSGCSSATARRRALPAFIRNLRRTRGARHRRRRFAADRARFHCRRHQATGANYWTPWLAFGDMTLRGSAALGRFVRPRGDAGVQVTEFGVGLQLPDGHPATSSLSR